MDMVAIILKMICYAGKAGTYTCAIKMTSSTVRADAISLVIYAQQTLAKLFVPLIVFILLLITVPAVLTRTELGVMGKGFVINQNEYYVVQIAAAWTSTNAYLVYVTKIFALK